MTSKEIETNLRVIAGNIESSGHGIGEEFIYEMLLAYGISKTSITRLRNGDFNRSKQSGEVLYGGKLFYTTAPSDRLLANVDHYATEERILKYKPRFVLLTDGNRFAGKDLKLQQNVEFGYQDLPNFYQFFLPLIGGEVYKQQLNNEADRNAAYELAKLYDQLLDDNPHLREGHSHDLNLFLARLLFCLFAEDTGIFEPSGIFTNVISQNTDTEGNGVDVLLQDLFIRLNTRDEWAKSLPRYVQEFPYVNGGLFRDEIEIPRFTRRSRELLLNACGLNWSEINPDIFGSMIQAVSDPEERGHLGMHYTSVENIKRVIRPLFLDELYEEYEQYKEARNERKLILLINRMSEMKFFDPACGSGNFLIITYKELRLLEIEILLTLLEWEMERGEPQFHYSAISLDQFYGIEIKDFAHEVAMLSLWLAEHQMNSIFKERLAEQGKLNPFLPLREAGHIVIGNAAQISWESVCPRTSPDDEIYLIGNPPYSGSRKQDQEQKADLEQVFRKDYKSLDYIAIWFYKGARYIEGHPNISLAFVSTNSICQGLMVGLTWPRVLNDTLEIGFAYTSYKWTNNAIGNAGVTVIIVALRNKSNATKYIFIGDERHEAKNINAYLIDAPDIIVDSRNLPLSEFPIMNFGNMPADGGHLLFTRSQYDEFLKIEPAAKKWMKRLISAKEFLSGESRYCLWLVGITKDELATLPRIRQRVEFVREVRLSSSRPQLANTPHLFAQITQPENCDFLLVPATTSENRKYIPIGQFDKDNIANNSTFVIASDEPWLFGVLHSRMHMVWVDAVGGKLKTDYRYSAKLCYNTFPLPELNSKDKYRIGLQVQEVLMARGVYEGQGKSIAWMYDPDTMPQELRDAHHELDLVVDRCYRSTPFDSDSERLQTLFNLYEEMTKRHTLFAKSKRTRKKKQ